MAKYICGEALTERLVRLRDNWLEIHDRLQAQLIPAEKIREMMGEAGCITHPKQMGKTLDDLRLAYTQARLIRNRYTILDLAAETGCMDSCLNELFAADGFWGKEEF